MRYVRPCMLRLCYVHRSFRNPCRNRCQQACEPQSVQSKQVMRDVGGALAQVFSKVGDVKRIVMGLDKHTMTPCGFCFVVYYTREDAEDCVKVPSLDPLCTCTLAVTTNCEGNGHSQLSSPALRIYSSSSSQTAYFPRSPATCAEGINL